MSTHVDATGPTRPRVEGDREQQILDATLAVLTEVGYDRLTMDAVASRAKASKATLYRRWNGKEALVVEALLSVHDVAPLPDTGTLRGDLIASFCGLGGLTDATSVGTFTAVLTAITHDPEFADAFRTQVIGPKAQASRTVFERARDRGEIPVDVDLDLLAPSLAGIVLHRIFLLGEAPDEALITRVIDQIILPAATGRR
ncbi:TetR/AcrR family transcriptional regulator [Nocardioides panaciterrulae]|uniref:AcrR family transcriptional regulator n=1 Tax=Nocardioides panaciterrulae TaxID=661492 RepID=A0A7Y9E7B6_9ACTN|nr:TetR/AcrR family transcriptional regulator [Nocardioides panaciterrulae]NYD42536.1 AcrR family transcriptional regulator [Nocardioides panaciterrulae]